MAWGLAMITDICRQPGDGAGGRMNLAGHGLEGDVRQADQTNNAHRLPST
jgi:hypothetical protein